MPRESALRVAAQICYKYVSLQSVGGA